MTATSLKYKTKVGGEKEKLTKEAAFYSINCSCSSIDVGEAIPLSAVGCR